MKDLLIEDVRCGMDLFLSPLRATLAANAIAGLKSGLEAPLAWDSN